MEFETAKDPVVGKLVGRGMLSKQRIDQNPLRKQRILSREMNISKQSISCIPNQDLGLFAYKWHTGQVLTKALKNARKGKSKELLHRHADNGHRRTLFTDGTIFTAEESFNEQNDRVYVMPSRPDTTCSRSPSPRGEKGHHPAVWWGDAYDGITKPH